MDTRMGFLASLLAGALVVAGAPPARAQGQTIQRCSEAMARSEPTAPCRDSSASAVSAPDSVEASSEPRASTPMLDLRLSPSAADSIGYGYPYRDPVIATISSALVNVDGITPGVKRQVVHVPGLPGRNRLPGLEGRGYVSVALYRQHHPAPLMVILSGIGSSAYFGVGTNMAALFHRAGFHVLILPSPMNWDFALAASRSGAPGYTPADARDVYDTLRRALTVLRERHGLEIRGVDFLGISLGALEGAYLSVLDAEEGRIGIQRYVLVNPPTDLDYALATLEQWLASRAALGPERAARLRGKALAIVEAHAEDHRSDPAAIESTVEDFSVFTTEELQYLIAQYVQMVFPELVYVTQAIHDQHLLSAPRGEVRQRLAEARAFTMKDYTEKIALPTWQRTGIVADSATASQGGSLAAILDRLRGNPRVHIVHSADDVLDDRASIEELKAIMGEQMTLYPYGGHLGTLWYPPIRTRMLGLFDPALEARRERRER